MFFFFQKNRKKKKKKYTKKKKKKKKNHFFMYIFFFSPNYPLCLPPHTITILIRLCLFTLLLLRSSIGVNPMLSTHFWVTKKVLLLNEPHEVDKEKKSNKFFVFLIKDVPKKKKKKKKKSGGILSRSLNLFLPPNLSYFIIYFPLFPHNALLPQNEVKKSVGDSCLDAVILN